MTTNKVGQYRENAYFPCTQTVYLTSCGCSQALPISCLLPPHSWRDNISQHQNKHKASKATKELDKIFNWDYYTQTKEKKTVFSTLGLFLWQYLLIKVHWCSSANYNSFQERKIIVVALTLKLIIAIVRLLVLTHN